jgi:2-keto-3-deoxy-L-rhamnonate aldolase RhmA
MVETKGMVDSLGASLGVLPPICRQLLSTVVIGPYDLSAAFGEVCSPSNSALITIMRRIEASAREAGLAVAIFARNCQLLEEWLAAGLRPELALVGYDRDIWSKSCSDLVATSRTLLGATSRENASSNLSPSKMESEGG